MAADTGPVKPAQRLGWAGGLAVGIGALFYLLSALPAWTLVRLALEVDGGWSGAALWLGPGWLAGLALGGTCLIAGARMGAPRTGALLFLLTFLLWVAPIVAVLVAGSA
ncbi:hypothetical protein BN1051_03102 [Arthrobacter saudimassiliensis]|uniref:Uncharacterized protein n=1 Tax=Arthrobacter saudimassiliensis TaxID=1461584 RepID=A0A078MTR5_9MICC|nr:hypothetical protein BN1051_03102 [Arthrobacter saudimassiliensis]